MTGHEEHVLQAAAAAQQLFKVCLRAHQAEAAAQEVYGRWIDLAEQLQQHKVCQIDVMTCVINTCWQQLQWGWFCSWKQNIKTCMC
jgi:hypothetical protein